MSEDARSRTDVKTRVGIREACAGDAERLVALSEQLGYSVTASEIVARMDQIHQDPTRALFVSIDADHQVMGFIDLDHRVIAVCGYSVEICGLVTDESVRGLGHGDALLRHAEDWARARGATEVGLRSNIIRTEAHGFYQRRGYQIYKQSYAFRKKI